MDAGQNLIDILRASGIPGVRHALLGFECNKNDDSEDGDDRYNQKNFNESKPASPKMASRDRPFPDNMRQDMVHIVSIAGKKIKYQETKNFSCGLTMVCDIIMI
jgi:hypothetical protein